MRNLGIAPICEAREVDERTIWVRYRFSLFSNDITTDIFESQGRLWVRVVDTIWSPPDSYTLVSKLSPDAFRRSLVDAELERLWSAEDRQCDDLVVMAEAGSMLEVKLGSEYFARVGPRAQLCDSEYSRLNLSVEELLNDVASRRHAIRVLAGVSK